MNLKPVDGDNLPELTCDELFLLMLLARDGQFVSSDDWWRRIPRHLRARYEDHRFQRLVTCLRQKGYVFHERWEVVVGIGHDGANNLCISDRGRTLVAFPRDEVELG
jgi:hypothetical protein